MLDRKRSTRKSGGKKGQTKKANRKVAKAVNDSTVVIEQYIDALKKGEATDMCLAIITKTEGGGRFKAFDMVHKENVTVRVSKKLFTKKAKHRNANIPIAVRPDSYVILNEAHSIVAVVGEADAYQIRQLIGVESNKNDLFNRS